MLESKNIDSNIINSFNVQKELNPKFWNENKELNSKILETLKRIAIDFFDSLEVNIPLEDILFVGSLVNYNWSKYSDIDLHLVLDFDLLCKTMHPEGEYEKEVFVKEYFNSKKKIWNDTHKIKIYGFDVEIYIQDINEVLNSNGKYSIKNNEWIKIPKLEEFNIDNQQIKRKAQELMNEIDSLEKQNNVQKQVDKLKEKIKKYRQSGLDKNGEFSIENLVFKLLRRNGYIEKLFKTKINDYDKQMSLNESIEEVSINGHRYYVDSVKWNIKPKDGNDNDWMSLFSSHVTKSEREQVFNQLHYERDRIVKENKNSNNIKWENLKEGTRVDIIDQIWRKQPHLGKEWNINTFKEYLDQMSDDLPLLKIKYYDVDVLFKQMENIGWGISDVQVKNLENLLKKEKKLDPVMINNEIFIDGGHRLTAYKNLGIKTIPGIDILEYLKIDWNKWMDGENDVFINELLNIGKILRTNLLLESNLKTYQAKLKDGRIIKKLANRDYNAVYVDVYDNGEHVVKGWSSNGGRLNEFKKEAKRYNEKKINQLGKIFPKYKLSKIIDTYIVKPKLKK